MPIDEKGRKKRARKAGKASGKARSAGHKQRNANICLAFVYLSNAPQDKKDEIKARQFLASKGINVRRTDTEEKAYRKLADGLGLTRARVWQIVKNYQKPTKTDQNKI